MKIVLAAVNAKYIHSNLAVYSLSAYGKTLGAQAEIAEYTINQQKDEILKSLFRKRPDVLCISCYIWNISYVEALISDLSKVLPQTELWLGGPEVSYRAVSMLEKHPYLRGIMKGEGEKTFAELALAYQTGQSRHGETDIAGGTENGNARQMAAPGGVEAGKPKEWLPEIAGITWRDGDGTIHENPWRPVMDLSEIPFPYEDLEDFSNRILYYESSRGCPFSCSYCLSSIDKKLRFRSLDLVREELQFFLDHKVPQVKFVDRTFNCRREHAMAVWTYLAEHDNQVTNFHFEIAADLITDDELALFRRLRPGLIQLEIGVQSTNPDTIREIHRKMDFEKVSSTVLEIQKGRNIHQHLDLIAGLPFEDYESFRRSFADVYRLKPQQLQLGFLKVLSGSYMAEHTGEYQCLYQEEEPYEVLSTRWLPYGDVLRLKAVEEMVEIYYNSRQFHCLLGLVEQMYENMFDFFAELGGFYEENGYDGLAHTRIRRYEILLDFLEKKHADRSVCEQLALMDLYARENLKARPAFAPDLALHKEETRRFYQREEREHRYLKHYEGYQWKQLMRMTHLEFFTAETSGNKLPDLPFLTRQASREGEENGGKTGIVLLFDYRVRDPLTGNARITRVDPEDESSGSELPDLP